ncbi:hypothetical protein D3C84_1264290 [compost metagenome]
MPLESRYLSGVRDAGFYAFVAKIQVGGGCEGDELCDFGVYYSFVGDVAAYDLSVKEVC